MRPSLKRSLLWLTAAALAVMPTAVMFGQQSQDNALPQLTTATGTLTQCDNELCVGETVVDFGPWWYLTATDSSVDYDGDGVVETLALELEGLIGVEVTLEVENGPIDADIYSVNGSGWRHLLDPPPWAGGPLLREPTPPADDHDDPAMASPGPPTVVTSPELSRVTVEDDEPTGLNTIEGALERCDNEWCVGETLVDFGPWWYLNVTQSTFDYDGDDALETLTAELEGLLGSTVVVEVEYGPGDPDVYSLSGDPWRAREGPPPWAGGPLRSPGTPVEAGPPENVPGPP